MLRFWTFQLLTTLISREKLSKKIWGLTMPKCTQKYRNKYAYFVTSSFTIQLNFPTKHTLGRLTRVLSAATETCFRVSIQFSSSLFCSCDHSIKHGNHFWPSIQLSKTSKRKMVTEFLLSKSGQKSGVKICKSTANFSFSSSFFQIPKKFGKLQGILGKL